MVNAWMQTVQRVKNSMPKGTALKDILIAAKKVYKKPKALADGVASTAKNKNGSIQKISIFIQYILHSPRKEQDRSI